MTAQYLEYIRQQLIVATADLSGCTKGQLLAWTENAQFDTKRLKRKRLRMWDEETEKMIPVPGDPVPGQQSRAKGSSIALVQPVEFSTASWRRALMTLHDHHKAWLLWNYSENVQWEHQVMITQWAWAKFQQQLNGKRVAKKTVDRLRQLIWLAAQDVKAGLAGRQQYEYRKLGELVGVSKSTWTETYLPHWKAIQKVFNDLDSAALLRASKSRSELKATNYQPDVAKSN